MPIRYDIGVENPKDHWIQVSMDIPDVTAPTVDLVMPAWVPGSYDIRDPARNVRKFRATQHGSGQALPAAKQDKARWRVSTGGSSHLEIRYEVYGHELMDDGNDATPEHLYVNPGHLLMYVDGRQTEPLELVVHVPSPWKVYTELPELGKSPARFRARDYDELVDSPIDCGTPVDLTTHPMGIPHRILMCGRGGNYEAHQLETDVGRVVESAIRIMGSSPLQHYTFFCHLSDAESPIGGGLEHKASTSLIVSRNIFRPAEDYRNFLALVAHEYFHLYNVKRIRPRVLGPFDYTKENYTHLLWAMEGSTDYFCHLILLRSGLRAPPKYLQDLGKSIRTYLSTPGRKVASLEEVSFNAWIDLYRPYEESPNASVSYYLKGDLVTLCLDLEIRHRTEGRLSVENVFQALWKEYGVPDRGLEETEILAVANRATGLDLSHFFEQYVSGTTEIDFNVFLGYAGLRLEGQQQAPGKEDEPVPGWLGVKVTDDGGRARIATVYEDGPGLRAGLAPGDEIVALDGQRVTQASLSKALLGHPPGSAVEVAVFRRGYLTSIPVETGHPPPDRLLIVPIDEASVVQRRVHEGWLGVPWEPRKRDADAGSPA